MEAEQIQKKKKKKEYSVREEKEESQEENLCNFSRQVLCCYEYKRDRDSKTLREIETEGDGEKESGRTYILIRSFQQQ